MKDGRAWLIICLLALVTAWLLAYPTFPVPEMVVLMLLGCLSLLLSFQRQVGPRFWLYSHYAASLALVLAGYYYPSLWAGLPLLACNFSQLTDYYSLLAALSLPFLRPDLLRPIPLLYLALIFSIYLSRLANKYQELRVKYFKTLDAMTSDQLRQESDRQRLLTENEISRENDILAERNRIAREIHDNVGHQLTAAILQTAALELTADTGSQPNLAQLKSNLEQALAEVRASIHQLHADSLNIAQALQNLAQNYHFCPVFLKVDIRQEPGAATHHAILAICREALANTAKHSNASRIDISLHHDRKNYQLLIVDNGSNPASPLLPARGGAKGLYHTGGGIGLYNMEDRVQQLGGQINIAQERGFRIFIRLPVSPGGAAAATDSANAGGDASKDRAKTP